MRPGVILINAARGAIVDEAAMIEALTSGHIRHVGIDVFGTEPLCSQIHREPPAQSNYPASGMRPGSVVLDLSAACIGDRGACASRHLRRDAVRIRDPLASGGAGATLVVLVEYRCRIACGSCTLEAA